MKSAFQEINHIFGQIESSYHDAAVKMHLSDSELWILYVLITSDESKILQTELIQITGIGKTTLNSALKKLEREEKVELTPGKGRNICVSLTEKGNQLAQETVCRLVDLENRIYEGWSPKDREVLIQLNRDYEKKLSEMVRSL